MRNKKVLFFYQLGQDLDVLLPAMKHSIEKGFIVKVLIKDNLFKSSPRTQCLKDLNLEIEELPKKYRFYHLLKTLKGCHVVVTATETNVGPHRDSHQLAKAANLCFKKTITLQHGYENLGLTYSDREYPIHKIKFASKVILTWSNEFHPDIPQRTLKKCIVAGTPKNYDSVISPATFKEREYIAIFENLHWGRFSEDYRKMFLELIEKSSKAFPDTRLLIKPHHAGKWLTSRYKGPKLDFHNVVILDPDSPEWEPYTAPALINYAKAVITTPSSVAIDAHLQNKPVAVLQFDLELSNYNFAKKCKSIDDVLEFIKEPNTKTETGKNLLDHDHFLKTFVKVLVG